MELADFAHYYTDMVLNIATYVETGESFKSVIDVIIANGK